MATEIVQITCELFLCVFLSFHYVLSVSAVINFIMPSVCMALYLGKVAHTLMASCGQIYFAYVAFFQMQMDLGIPRLPSQASPFPAAAYFSILILLLLDHTSLEMPNFGFCDCLA